MKIIAFTGMPCSGKSVAVQIAKDKGIPVVRMGDAVWEETKRQGLALTDTNVGIIADSMRTKWGKDIWARRTAEKIKTLQNTEMVVIDGVRNKEEIDYFKNTVGADFLVIAIIASDEIRRKRVLSRGREDDSTTVKDFEERDKRELRWGLKTVIDAADIVLSNEGSLEEFKEDMTLLLEDLMSTIE